VKAALVTCRGLAAYCVLAASVSAHGQPAAPAGKGALARIGETGVVRIGYRENASPFSSAAPGAQPRGYSIDLCQAVVEDLSAALGGKSLRIEYRPVTTESRLDQVARGGIDLECGATTITEERSKRVAFSPPIFVAGTRLLVKRGSALHGMRDMAGRTIVTVTGTTNARAMLSQAAGAARGLRVSSARSYETAVAMLDNGAADALAADDILITGFLQDRGLRDRYIMVGETLTQDLYGIAHAPDPALADVVKVTFARLAASRELRTLHEKWFQPLGLPMGAHLESLFQGLGLPPR
jgi:ABC-type amino acid transport substrate-binding protein